MTNETKKNSKDTYLINDGGYGIEVCDDDLHILHFWGKGVSVWMDKDEMYEFLEVMTNEENQKKMKDKMLDKDLSKTEEE